MRRRILGTTRGEKATFVLVVAALTTGAGGCSFIFSEGAPAGHERMAYFDCGEGVTPPILDTVATGYFGLLTASTATATPRASNADTVEAVQAGIALLAAASAVYGYTSMADCRAAKHERAAQVAQAVLLPPPYGVPPYGAPPPLWPPAVYWPPPPTAPLAPPAAVPPAAAPLVPAPSPPPPPFDAPSPPQPPPAAPPPPAVRPAPPAPPIQQAPPAPPLTAPGAPSP
jgi:hypothetical protein